MKVFIERTEKEKILTFTGTVKDLLSKIKINPEEVLVVKGDEVLTEDDKLTNADSIKLLSVISGG